MSRRGSRSSLRGTSLVPAGTFDASSPACDSAGGISVGSEGPFPPHPNPTQIRPDSLRVGPDGVFIGNGNPAAAGTWSPNGDHERGDIIMSKTITTPLRRFVHHRRSSGLALEERRPLVHRPGHHHGDAGREGARPPHDDRATSPPRARGPSRSRLLRYARCPRDRAGARRATAIASVVAKKAYIDLLTPLATKIDGLARVLGDTILGLQSNVWAEARWPLRAAPREGEDEPDLGRGARSDPRGVQRASKELGEGDEDADGEEHRRDVVGEGRRR